MSCQRSIFHALTPEAFILDVILMLASTIFQMVVARGGHIVFLCDSSDRCCLLTWSSTKLKRVVRSTLAAETLSLVDSSDTAIYLLKLTGACVNDSNYPMKICCITDKNQSSDILQHPQNRPTGDRWLKFQNTTIQIIKQNCKLDISN